MNTIKFFVPGKPATAGSKRGFVNKKTGKILMVDDCKRNPDWKNTCRAFAYQAYQRAPTRAAVTLSVDFWLPRPKSHYGTGKNATQLKSTAPRYHTTIPDATKLLRCLEDALTGILWRDDAQIVSQTVTKRYADDGERIGAQIMCRTFKQEKDNEATNYHG